MRPITAFLLVAAAVLRAVELLIEPIATIVHPLGSLFIPIQIGVEFVIGLLVLRGVYSSMLRRLMVVSLAQVMCSDEFQQIGAGIKYSHSAGTTG